MSVHLAELCMTLTYIHKSLTGETCLLSFITATERMKPGGRGGVGGGSVGPAGGSGFHPHAPCKTWGLHPGLPRHHLAGQTDSGLIPSPVQWDTWL